MREGGKILHHVLYTVAAMVKPGISGLDLDREAEKMIRAAGGVPSFKDYGSPPYPATLCVSVNEEVVHGIPLASQIFEEGDIVGLDIGMLYNGFHTDMAITVGVGKVSKEAQRLMDVAQQSLRIIEENIAPGVDWQYISRLAQQHVEKHGFGMVRSLVGHGVGKDIHEEPQLPNYVIKDYHLILKEGMVLACEPMVTAGSYQVDVLDDEWTFATTDGSLSAHFENSIAVTSNGAEILTGE